MEDRATAQNMTSSTELLVCWTTYIKSKEEETKDTKGSNDTNPNTIDFPSYDYPDDDGNDDYYINEGYTQRSERSHGHLTYLGAINANQMISARISEQGSSFASKTTTRFWVLTFAGAETWSDTSHFITQWSSLQN